MIPCPSLALARSRLTLWLLSATTLLHFISFPYAALARPRPTQPPWPAPGQTCQEGFDRPGLMPDAQTGHPTDWVESWSGWALNRTRQQAAFRPWTIPMLNSDSTPNLPFRAGAYRVWIKPDFTSGSGPGHPAHLLTLISAGRNNRDDLVWWSLLVTPDGRHLELQCQTDDGPAICASGNASLETGVWAMISLCFTETNSLLFLNDQQIALGGGLPTVPPRAGPLTRLIIGGVQGQPAAAELDEFAAFSAAKRLPQKYLPFGLNLEEDIRACYGRNLPQARLGPITPEEDALRKANANASRSRAAAQKDAQPLGAMQLLSLEMDAPIGLQLTSPRFQSTNGTNLLIDVVNAEAGARYTLIATTNDLTNACSTWSNVVLGSPGQTTFTSPVPASGVSFFRLLEPAQLLLPGSPSVPANLVSPIPGFRFLGLASTTVVSLTLSVTNGKLGIGTNMNGPAIYQLDTVTNVVASLSNLKYLPNTNFMGISSLSIVVTNPFTASANLSVLVTTNLPPTIQTNPVYDFYGPGVNFRSLDRLTRPPYAHDPEGQTIFAVPQTNTPGQFGTLTLGPGGDVLYHRDYRYYCASTVDAFPYQIYTVDAYGQATFVSTTLVIRVLQWPIDQGVGGLAITSPTNNATFLQWQDIPISAGTGYTNECYPSSPTQVQYFLGTNLLGSCTNSPFTLTWSNVPPVTNGLLIAAADFSGFGSLTSAAVQINILADSDQDGISDAQEVINGSDPSDYYNGVLPKLWITGGSWQAGLPGSTVPSPLTVAITGANGAALCRAPITFTTTPSNGLLQTPGIGFWTNTLTVRSDAFGQAFVSYQLPNSTNVFTAITATVQVPSTSVAVTFSECSTAQVSPTSATLDVYTPLE